MNKNWLFLLMIIFTLFLGSFALDRVAQNDASDNATATPPAFDNTPPSGVEAIPLTRLEYPIAYAFAGMIGITLLITGAMAIAPLLMNDANGVDPINNWNQS